MNLRGTKTEDEFRAELLRSKNSIFIKGTGNHLGAAIRDIFPDLISAYVLHWIPEQCEDIYLVLVNGKSLLSIEMDREGKAKPEIEHMDLEKYRKSLTKINQIKLMVALQLSSKDANEHNK